MVFVPTIVFLLALAAYCGALERWATRAWRAVGYICMGCVLLFIGGCAVKILVTLARLLYWR